MGRNSFNWTCPFCDHTATIQDEDQIRCDFTTREVSGKHGQHWIFFVYVVCPNTECREFSLLVMLHEARKGGDGAWKRGKEVKSWRLVPESSARTFPSYIPAPI